MCVCTNWDSPGLQQSFALVKPQAEHSTLCRPRVKASFVAGAILMSLNPVFSLASASLKSLGLHVSSRLSFNVVFCFGRFFLGFFLRFQVRSQQAGDVSKYKILALALINPNCSLKKEK